MNTSPPDRRVSINDTPYLFPGGILSTEVESVIEAALRAGHVVHENGITRWIQVTEVLRTGVPADAPAAARCHWHPDGTRVRSERILVTRGRVGAPIRQSLGFFWAPLS